MFVLGLDHQLLVKTACCVRVSTDVLWYDHLKASLTTDCPYHPANAASGCYDKRMVHMPIGQIQHVGL